MPQSSYFIVEEETRDDDDGGGAAAVAALCLVQFVDVLGVTVVVTALPSMLTGLHAPPSAAALVATAYAMFFGGLLMLGARLGDRYGPRRVLLIGLAAFGAASLLAATAWSVTGLVAARCAQGAAAAASVPAALRLLTAAAPDEDARRRALAAWSATGAAAGASGLVLGGLLTDLAGWRAVFWVNLPLAVVLVLAVRASAPAVARERTGRLDLVGAALLTGSVMGLVLGSSILERPGQRLLGLAVAATGVGLLVALVHAQRRAAEPLLPSAAVRHPRLRLGVAAAMLNTATTSSVITLATLHLQNTRGVSPSAAGARLLPFSLCVVAGSALAAPLIRRHSPRVGVALGLAAIAAGDAVLLALPAAEWLLPVGVAIAGAGIGLSSVAANILGTDVPPALQGTASGALNTAAQLGTALGVAGLLLVAATTRGSGLPLAGTPLAWGCAAAIAAAGAGAMLIRPRAVRSAHPRSEVA
jgi:MFS family permease